MRLIKVTYPYIRDALRNNVNSIVLLVLVSIVLGVIPVMKSGLESSIISRSVDFIRQDLIGPRSLDNPVEPQKKDLNQFFNGQISLGGSSDKSDVVEALPGLFFDKATVITALISYAVILVLSFIVNLISIRLKEKISADIFTNLRGAGFQKGLIVDPSDIPNIPNAAGQFTSAIHKGADNISNTYTYALDIGQNVFSLFTVVVILATVNPYFAAVSLVFIIILLMLSVYQAKKLENQRNIIDTSQNELIAKTDDILNKREIILAYDQQSNYYNKIQKITKNYSQDQKKLAVAEQKYGLFTGLIDDVGRMSIIFIAVFSSLFLAKDSVSGIADLFFLTSLYTRLYYPASSIIDRYSEIKRSEASSKTYIDVINQKNVFQTADREKGSSSNIMKDASILFKDVTFKYQEDRNILKNCSFMIPEKKTTLIVGRSGSGKTTITRIILGFWPIAEGEVIIGGKPISSWNLDDLRAQMSYVSQGDHIVDETIRENLSWGYSQKSIDDQSMVAVLKRVGIIGQEGGGILSKQAKTLSGGQQQRLSIARMMLDESSIVILDEPLTGIDVFTLHDLLPLLDMFLRQTSRTVLMFSHNLALAAYADYVIVLNDEGSVAEEGSPRDLLNRKDSIFSQLHSTALKELTLTK